MLRNKTAFPVITELRTTSNTERKMEVRMITIVDDNSKKKGARIYSIMLGQQLVYKFEYDILDGIAGCLQTAADAVELSDWVEFAIMDDSKGG